MVPPKTTSSAAASEVCETRVDSCNAGSRCLRRCLRTGEKLQQTPLPVKVQAVVKFNSSHLYSDEPVRSFTASRFGVDLINFWGCFALIPRIQYYHASHCR